MAVTVILSSLVFVTCFLFPLALTGKVLSNIAALELRRDKAQISPSQLVANLQFLLHYWICFGSVAYFESILAVQLLMSLGGVLGTGLSLISATLKMWLFYGHGCLIFNKVYLSAIGVRMTGGSEFSFKDLERTWIDPISMIVLSRKNKVLRWALGLLSRVLHCDFVITLNSFIERMPYNTSFLQYSLREICYVDTNEELHTQYHETIAFIGGLVSSVASSPAHTTNKTKNNTRRSGAYGNGNGNDRKVDGYSTFVINAPQEKKSRRSFSDPECDPVVWKTRQRSVSCNEPRNIPSEIRSHFSPRPTQPQVFEIDRQSLVQLSRRSRISSPLSVTSEMSNLDSFRSMTPVSIDEPYEVMLPLPVSAVSYTPSVLSREEPTPKSMLQSAFNALPSKNGTKVYSINPDFFHKNKHKFSLTKVLNPTAVRFVKANTAPYPTH